MNRSLLLSHGEGGAGPAAQWPEAQKGEGGPEISLWFEDVDRTDTYSWT